MINFEEEIKRFKPSLDVEQVEDAIVKSDLTDMTGPDDGTDQRGAKIGGTYGLCKEKPADCQQLL